MQKIVLFLFCALFPGCAAPSTQSAGVADDRGDLVVEVWVLARTSRADCQVVWPEALSGSNFFLSEVDSKLLPIGEQQYWRIVLPKRVRSNLDQQARWARYIASVDNPYIISQTGPSLPTIRFRELKGKPIRKKEKEEPNQALQTTPMTRSVYEKTIEFGYPQRGV